MSDNSSTFTEALECLKDWANEKRSEQRKGIEWDACFASILEERAATLERLLQENPSLSAADELRSLLPDRSVPLPVRRGFDKQLDWLLESCQEVLKQEWGDDISLPVWYAATRRRIHRTGRKNCDRPLTPEMSEYRQRWNEWLWGDGQKP